MSTNPNQRGWYYNENNCVACRACEGACKQEFNLPAGVRRRRVLIKEEGKYPKIQVRYLSTSCHHCEDPACMKACPSGAITKESQFGAVLIDQEKCIGCKRCAAACPYGAPTFDEKKQKMDKCTLCVHRLKEGLAPACVSSCMGYALWSGKMGDILSRSVPEKVYQLPLQESLPGLADPKMTIPSIRFSEKK